MAEPGRLPARRCAGPLSRRSSAVGPAASRAGGRPCRRSLHRDRSLSWRITRYRPGVRLIVSHCAVSAYPCARNPLRRERSRRSNCAALALGEILLSDSSSRRDAHPCRRCPSDLLRPEPAPGPGLTRFAPPLAASGRDESWRQGEARVCRRPQGVRSLQPGLARSRPSGPDPAPAPVPVGRIRGDGGGKALVPASRR